MGNGTTAKVALLSGRNYLGSEISSEYYLISMRRLESIEMVQNKKP
jgi:DNA modification methylase